MCGGISVVIRQAIVIIGIGETLKFYDISMLKNVNIGPTTLTGN